MKLVSGVSEIVDPERLDPRKRDGRVERGTEPGLADGSAALCREHERLLVEAVRERFIGAADSLPDETVDGLMTRLYETSVSEG